MSVRIGVLNPEGLERGTQRALEEFVENLEKQNIFVNFCLYSDRVPDADIMIGTYDKSKLVRKLIDEGRLNLYKNHEALIIQEIEFEGKSRLFACGYDGSGLTYALYELAERVRSQSVMNLVDPLSEKPDLEIREIFTFFNNYDLDSIWFYDPEYWESYFSILARNRLNSFTLVFGYHNSNFIPFIPHFITLPEYEEVVVEGISPEELSRNKKTLRIITETAIDYGIDFNLGIWQIKTGIEKEPLSYLNQAIRFNGLTPDNHDEYTYLALKRLISEFPGIKGFSIRRVCLQSQASDDKFFLNTFGRVLSENGYSKNLKLCESDFLPETIEKLIVKGVNVHISTKYGNNTLTLPSYPPRLPKDNISQKDHTPQLKPFHEIWGCGSHRILLWGNPDYLRRLTNELKSFGSMGVSVTPHLALRGFGNERGNWELLCSPHHYYTWDFERYWYFYTVFGRLLYNPGTSGEILIREFIRRFGKKGLALADIYHLASEVLSIYNNFHDNCTHGRGDFNFWSEIDTGGVLDFYYQTPPSDKDIYCSCSEYVQEYLRNKPSGRVTPEAVAIRLESLGKMIIDKIDENSGFNLCETDGARTRDRDIIKEWKITLNDFYILGNLALFHSEKIRSAIGLGLYYETNDLVSLYSAVYHLSTARKYWEKIVAASEEVYYHWMVTGPIDSGHWASKLPLIREDEERLRLLIKEHLRRGILEYGFDFGGSPPTHNGEDYSLAPVLSNYHVERGYILIDHRASYSEQKGYGWEKSAGLIAISPPLVRLTDKDLDPMRRDTKTDYQTDKLRPYSDQLRNDLVLGYNPATFRVDLKPGAYQIRILLCDRSPKSESRGPMTITLNDRVLAENLTIPTGKEVILSDTIDLTDSLSTHARISFEALPEGDWFISALEIVSTDPVIKHSPPKWEKGEPLFIKACVFGLNSIKHVNLYYQTESGETPEKYQLLPMTLQYNSIYEVEVKPKTLWGEEKIYYYLTASDGKKEVMLGSPEDPLSIRWGRETNPNPYCYHTVPERVTNSESIKVDLKVSPPDIIKEIFLCCRRINSQTLDKNGFLEIPMKAESEKFTAEIPDKYLSGCSAVLYHFRVITKLERGFVYPDPFQTSPYYLIRF